MGRLSRYKKVKSIDPFAKNGSWKSDVGDCSTLHRVKKKSKTALRLKEQKASKLQRRSRGKNDKDIGGKKNTGGSNGWGDDDGYDLPPDGEDEFDMKDLTGSVKKKTHKSNPLLETKIPAQLGTLSSSPGGDKLTRQVENVDLRGVGAGSNVKNVGGSAQSSKKATKDGALKITARTSTRDIIEAHSNPKSQNQNKNNASTSSFGLTKQEKRKAFLDKKKLKKRQRKRGGGALNDDDDDDDYANQEALKSLHSQSSSYASSAQQKQGNPKKHLTQQQNFSDTLVARTAMDDQVERPPTFTSLPRGANKLSKNKKPKLSYATGEGSGMEEGDSEKSQRIRKEQQALELMRERVMKQYALLRESRRNGGR